jgi:hypothetical protein
MEDITKAELITVEAIEAETAYINIKSDKNVSETEKESKRKDAEAAAKNAAEAANKVAAEAEIITNGAKIITGEAIKSAKIRNAAIIVLEEARSAYITIS